MKYTILLACILDILSNSVGASESLSTTPASKGRYTTPEQWAATGWDNKFTPLFLNLFKLRWHDEFDKCDIELDPPHNKPDRSERDHHWYAEIRSAQRSNMVGPLNSPSPFKCSDGILSITLSKPAGKQWQGGELRALSRRAHGFTFSYGYAEARIKFPKPPPGLVPWPAFWFLSVPPKGRCQIMVELDVVEPGLTSSTNIEAQSTTIHEWPENSDCKSGQITSHAFTGFRPNYSTFDNTWHTYGFEKSERNWIVFRDGLEFGRYPVLGAEMDYPVYPLLDVALKFDPSGAKLGSKYTMLIDYVRIYEPSHSTLNKGQ